MRPRMAGGIGLALAPLVVWVAVTGKPVPAQDRGSIEPLQSIGGADDFQRALEPSDFQFPADHGAHPDYRTEWWYFTGVLKDEAGRAYGFELTFFRVGLVAELPERQSKWAARDILFAHFALTDVDGRRFVYSEKTGRPVLGLAGYETGRMAVHIADWQAVEDEGIMRLRAVSEEAEIDLELREERPPAPNGNRGLSQKGPEPGNANYYYSVPRLATSGTLRVDRKRVSVSGMTWMDHEWGTSELAPNQEGWDWFSLRLSDGRDLMVYVLRDRRQQATRFSSGTLVQPDGRIVRLGPSDFELRATGRWRSPKSGGEYPSGWNLSLPGHGIRLDVQPVLKDQELVTSGTTGVTYWEGMVRASGSTPAGGVTGEGYVELTGYAPGTPSPGSARR